MLAKQWLVAILFVFLGMNSLSAAWSETSLAGDHVHIFMRSPARMERYDLVNEEWEETILLPEKADALSAAFADNSGLYLAYGSSLYRYDLEAQNETFVLSQTNPIFRLGASDDYGVAVSGTTSQTQFVSFRKSNNGLGATQGISRITPSPDAFFKIDPETGVIYYANFSTLRRITVDSSGAFVNASSNLNFRLKNGQGVNLSTMGDLFPYPSENLFLGGQGRVFSETSTNQLIEAVSTGLSVRDVVFRGLDTPIVMEPGRVVALRNNLTVAGQEALDFQGRRLFLFGDNVFVFGEGEDGPTVAKISLDSLGSPEPDAPLDPDGLAYDPDYVFVDRAGIVNIYSRNFANIFRWDPATQQPLTSIKLDGNPLSYFYSPTINRFYFAYSTPNLPEESRIDYIDYSRLGNPIQNLTTGGGEIGAIMDAGSAVLVQDRFSDTRLLRSNGTVQATGNSFLSIPNNGGASIAIWDASTRRVVSGAVAAVSTSGGQIGNPIFGQGGLASNAQAILIGPNRAGLLFTTGEFTNLSDYTKLTLSLGNAIEGATNFGTQIATIREISGLTQVQSWSAPNFAPDQVKQLPGSPASIIQVDENSILAVVIGDNSFPNFYLLDQELKVIPPDSLEAPLQVLAGAAGSTSAEITWLDGSGEEEYIIERRVTGVGEFEEVGTVGTSITSFTDVGLSGAGTDYEYRVIAVNGDLRSDPSAPAEARFVLPGEVTGLTVTDITEQSATMNWDLLDGVTGYEVQAVWILNNSPVIPNPQPSATDTSYTFFVSGFGGQALRIDTEYNFRIRGVNGLGNGPWTSLIARTLPPLPGIPTNLRQGSAVTSYFIDLRWSNTASGGSNVIERRELGVGEFVEVGRVDSSSSYRDFGLQPLTAYEYRVRFENVRGTSAFTEPIEISTTELIPPNQPQFFQAMNVVGGIRLNFGYGSLFGQQTVTTASSFLIERRLDEDGDYVLIEEQDIAEENSLLDDTVLPGFTYRYRIFARNAAGISTSAREVEILAIDGACLVNETFDQELDNPFVRVTGGEVITDGGEGFPETGVLYFGGAFERAFVTEPLDLRYGGSIDLRMRLGDQERAGSATWDRIDNNAEFPLIQYLSLDESFNPFGGPNDWRNLGSLAVDLTDPSGTDWASRAFSIPAIGSDRGVLIRIIQNQFDGPGLDTWALDRICILGHQAPNQAPTLDPTTPVVLNATPTGDPIRLGFDQYLTETDFHDRVYYEIGAVSNPSIFSGFTIDLDSGLLDLQFAPQASGSSTLEVIASDSAGGNIIHTFTVNAPVLPALTVVREGLVELNAATGKYEQTLTIANNGAREIAGFQIVVTSLNNGFVLSGQDDNTALSDSPLAPGETRSLVLEYHSETSGVAPRPDFIVQILNPEGEAQEPGGGTPALRDLSDSGKLFSFDAVVGQTYQIEYSYDMATWSTSPVTVTAGSNRAQWLDQGPPKTDCHPSECSARFYRVVPLTTD